MNLRFLLPAVALAITGILSGCSGSSDATSGANSMAKTPPTVKTVDNPGKMTKKNGLAQGVMPGMAPGGGKQLQVGSGLKGGQ